ncbi:hypothetical protein JXK06_00215 [Patescibacteria group bacterium]|nr:hypothetical protein [Patescibacteria group bacterium]
MFLLIILVIIFCLKVVPSGKASYKKTWTNSFFSARGTMLDFRPDIRLDSKTKSYLKIIAEPVYFNFYSPRSFSKAKVTVKYFDNLAEATPIIEVGLLKGGVSGNYELKPLQNKIIDDLKFSWNRVVDDGETLILQREKVYRNELDFFADFSEGRLENCVGGPMGCAVFYNYDHNYQYKALANNLNRSIKINQALRGEHQFFNYFNQGSWFLNFNFRDLNLSSGQEIVKVNIYLDNNLIASQSLNGLDLSPSNENFNNENRQGEFIGELRFSGLAKTGSLYKVEIKASNDIIIESIESSSDQLVFANKLWPVYSEGLKISTEAKFLSVKTFETESLGNIFLNEEKFELDKTYSSLLLEAKDEERYLNELKLEKSGVLIELNGFIALPDTKFFKALPEKMDRFFSASGSASYLLSNYKSPKKEKNYQVASLEFDLEGAYLNNKYYSFVISVPGLELTEGGENYLGIKEIKIEVEGRSLAEKIMGLIKK